jgi:hypothetical protein
MHPAAAEHVVSFASADSGLRRLSGLLDSYVARKELLAVMENQPDRDEDDVYHLSNQLHEIRSELAGYIVAIADAIRREGGL